MPNFQRLFTDALLLILFLGLLMLPVSFMGLTSYEKDVRFDEKSVLSEQDINVKYFTITDPVVDTAEVSESTQSADTLDINQ